MPYEGKKSNDWFSAAKSRPQQRNFDKNVPKKSEDKKPKGKWSEEQNTQLKQIVETMKANGEVNWEQVGQQCDGRTGQSCYNRFVQLSEPEWTAEQDLLLGKYWQENHEKFDFAVVLPQLGEHTKRGTQFRLTILTQEPRGGKYKPKYTPVYRMTQEEMQKCD